MFVRINHFIAGIASALLLSAIQPAMASDGPVVSQQTRAGVIRVVKDNWITTIFMSNRLLYKYTQGDCSGVQWHGYSGSDELTLIYASSCANGEGIYPTWRLIVVKPDHSVELTAPLAAASDVRISQLGERITFASEKTIAGVYQQGQLVVHGKPVAFSAIPAIE
jgi:hypothetical protein